MLQRRVFRTPALVAVAGLALVLSAMPQALAAAGQPAKVVHLQISLYELREAKEDVREVKGIPDGERTKILGGIDSAVQKLKDIIVAMGGKPDYVHPKSRPNYPDFQHLRHAVKMLKEAKEQLRTEEGVPSELRQAGIQEINRCVDHLEKALDHVK
jgi:hypothetical protein